MEKVIGSVNYHFFSTPSHVPDECYTAYDPFFLHQPDYGGINTLFVSGLPDDVKAREIHNLFRRRPGFDSCQLKYTGRGNQVVAFATFVNHQSALAALHSLNGVQFDPQTGSVLHIEMARSNSRRKRKPGSGAYVVIDNRNKAVGDAQESSGDDSGESEADEAPGDEGDLKIPKGEAVDNPETAVPTENAEKTIDDVSQDTVDGVSRCSTLFIANLGPNCTDDELKQVLSPYSGFKAVKVRARGGMPVAFADFEGIEQATQVMDALQGSWLGSSDRGGMHIEYARSKMRKS
ncbi:hypothetical protein RHSIM_Rhsim08G0232400 [Rhododendron simsii]|uniref:RRM domain-containing protein n=1 Tax=Rhododendron simsii TaxID=118357 RepID=A0A834GK27_RHOSS|nr:hypothetical protein RHSIM_Rhsim08G0232400 [Rhododendron simsii]